MTDPFNLGRFVDAQQGIFEDALDELRAGRKRSHWMWFIFPQHAALGRSATALRYGIGSAREARAYLDHPLLGRRLIQCTEAMLAHRGQRPDTILGSVDAMKFRSSMSLFDAAASHAAVFAAALDAFYGGARDELTLRLLAEDC